MASARQLRSCAARARQAFQRAKPGAVAFGGVTYAVGIVSGPSENITHDRGPASRQKTITFLLDHAIHPTEPAVGTAITLPDDLTETGVTFFIESFRDQLGSHWLVKAATSL